MEYLPITNDDSQIKEGDYCYYIEGIAFILEVEETTGALLCKNRLMLHPKKCKKITHSTQPLSDKPHYAEYGMLTVSGVEEAIYGYNVEKMANDLFDEEKRKSAIPKQFQIRRSVDVANIIKGFNAHKEFMKDKLFTVEDMRKAIGAAFSKGNNRITLFDSDYDSIIQSLLPPTEWKVTFDEQGKLKLI